MNGFRQAVIRIVSESDGERMDITVPGEGEAGDGTVALRWTERLSEDGGLSDETRVSLRARQGYAMMQRRGVWAVSMVFDPGTARESAYHTPYGDLPMQVEAREVSLSGAEDGGELIVAYALSVQGGPPDERRLSLKWRWADAEPGEG